MKAASQLRRAVARQARRVEEQARGPREGDHRRQRVEELHRQLAIAFEPEPDWRVIDTEAFLGPWTGPPDRDDEEAAA